MKHSITSNVHIFHEKDLKIEKLQKLQNSMISKWIKVHIFHEKDKISKNHSRG